MMNIRIFFPLFVFSFLAGLDVSAQENLPLAADNDSVTGKVIIINSFDAGTLKTRKNKKEFFGELSDSLKGILFKKLYAYHKERLVIIPGVVKQHPYMDSTIVGIMNDQHASTAIVIRSMEAFFRQTGVEVEGEKNDKTRKVSWDLCSIIKYVLYSTDEAPKESEIELCEPYTTRNSMSGVFAFGPDIVSKHKDVYKNVEKNVEKLFLAPDMPMVSGRKRTLERRVKPTDTLMKYSLSFADQSQMAYDGSKLKNYINQPLIESGDVAYYRGHYFNSRMRYLFALGELPWAEHGSDTTFHALINEVLDSNKIQIEYVRIYTRTISTIGMLFQTRGKFALAELLLTRAMKMRLQRFGESSREYLNSVHNYAVLKKDMGSYDEADSIFSKILPAFESQFGARSYQYVLALNNKAMLLAELGRTKEATKLLDQALVLGDSVLSPDYIDYERILTNRALLEQEAGNFDKAETLYQQALSNMEKKEFEDHPDYNNVMVYYGSLRVEKNDPEVLGFLTKVYEKVRKRYKDNHPLTAKALSNIGDYYLQNKAYDEARKIWNQVAAIQVKVLTEKHKDYLNTLIKLAVCEWQLKDDANAAIHFNKAIQNYLSLLNLFFRSMSEFEKTSFWRTLKPAIDTYLAYAIERSEKDPSILKDAYNLQIKTKGVLINSTKQSRDLILNSGDSTVLRLYNEWLSLKHNLSNYYSSTLEELEEDKIDLTAMEQKANELEKDLSRKSSQFNATYGMNDISFDDIRGKLKAGEMAIEIIRIFHYYGEKGSEYIALGITRDSEVPKLVHIGDGELLEKDFLTHYRKCIINKVNDEQSYEHFWKPLETLAGSHKTIYISIDGVYNSISLNTLRRKDGTFLIDDYNLVLVPATKAIVNGLKSQVSLSGNESAAMLLGSPDYGNDAVIPPLPGTREEIEKIDTLLIKDHVKTKIFIGEDASEENFKSANHPLVLHVATHGFFNENIDLSKRMNMGVQVSRAKDNALLRSGLLFNGAAAVYSQEPMIDASNNGILYAYEAMNLNLQNTKLVVLSACETGVGEIVNGEGVYGLSRSFQVAGADKILMSLWKVDDQTTRQLMVSFYQHWLKSNDPQDAFVRAMKSIKQKYPQPYYWGAFVLLN